ncbi:MAG: hypothetical protein IJE43_02575 [Alphaproteobacteria bacterium]|nr:hypothetical protein [Alphaproteobacteria bacterium]
MSAAINTSMLKKIKEFIVGRKSDDISPQEAEKIQKAAYALSKTEAKKKYSPVYLSFLPGLDSEEKQVFEATVYYLVKIASNKAKYRQEILDVLNEKISQTGYNPEFREYIKQQLQNISLKNN